MLAMAMAMAMVGWMKWWQIQCQIQNFHWIFLLCFELEVIFGSALVFTHWLLSLLVVELKMQRNQKSTLCIYIIWAYRAYTADVFPSDKETIESEISWLVVRRPSCLVMEIIFKCLKSICMYECDWEMCLIKPPAMVWTNHTIFTWHTPSTVSVCVREGCFPHFCGGWSFDILLFSEKDEEKASIYLSTNSRSIYVLIMVQLYG